MNNDLPIFPENWNTAQIRRKLCDVDGIRIGPFGSALTLDQMVEEGFKVYGQENVISQDFKAGNRFLSCAKYAELKACSIASGDLLVTMMGTTGRCCVVPEEIDEGIMDSHLIRLRFQNQEVDPLFMALLIDKGHYVKEQIGAGGKGTIMSGLNSSIIKDVWVALPEVTVQRRIIKYIDDQTAKIDRLMDMRRRQMALLKEQRAALIQQAVTRGLDPNAPMKDTGLPWLGEIPKHWTITRIRYLGQFLGGGTPSKANVEYWDGTIPWVSPKDMKDSVIKDTEDHITPEGLRNSPCQIIPPDSLLMVVRSGILRNTLPVATNNLPVALNQDMRALIPNASVLTKFLRYLVQGCEQQLLKLWCKDGSTVESIEHDLMASTWIALPTIEEQEEIVSHLDVQGTKVAAISEAYARQLTLLTEYRAALIHECVTGQRPAPSRHTRSEENAHAL